MGQLSNLPDVRVETGRVVRIDGEPGLPVQGDGDIIATLPVEIRISDKTLDLIVP